ncbi:PucR family transcriptional regulator [Mobilicoccus caccae]|nr:helix-turn-helix domain-containing protein [Mobilicoccus caccae]
MTGGLTPAALAAHPANGGMEVLTTIEGCVWRDVVVEAREEDLPDSAQDCLAVLTSPVAAEPWRVDALLRRVRDRGFTGLAVGPEPEIGWGSRVLAQRLGLVLVVAGHPTALARACWELVEGRDALTLSLVRRVAGSIEYHADDIGDLVRHLSAGIGHALALVDGVEVLHRAGPAIDPDLLAAIDTSRWVHQVWTPTAAAVSVRVDTRARAGLRLVIHAEGIDEPHLVALTTAAEIAMPAVAARILIDEIEDVSDVSRSSSLLADVLDAAGSVDAELHRRVTARGWRVHGWHLGFRVQSRARVDPLDLLRRVRPWLHSLPVETHATTRGRGVTGWFTFTSAPDGHGVDEAAGAIREMHRALLADLPVATGIGSVHSGPSGLVTTLGEAHDAARLATGRPSTHWLLHVDSLGLEQLLLAWTGTDTFVPAARALLGRLRPADRATLGAYLDHESSLLRTAESLGLHRNTVRQRMQRVQEVLGLDLQDPDVRLAVHLACRAVSAPHRGRE